MRLKLTILFSCAALLAQAPTLKVESAEFTRPGAGTSPYIRVVFSKPVVQPPAASIKLENAPAVHIAGLDISTDPKVVNVLVDRALRANPSVRICFTGIQYHAGDQTQSADLCADVATISKEEIKKRRDAILDELRNKTKTSSEKDIFASGFVTTASSGSQGGAQIALNPDLGIRGMNTFLNINKTTQTGGDPKNLEGGVRWRYVRSMASALMNDAADTPPSDALNHLVTTAQQNVVAGMLFDLAAKLEGEATNFNVTNFVGESALSFRSVARAIGESHGHYRWFVTPVAFEGGRNLNSQGQPLATTAGTASSNSPKDVDYVARYKAGLGFVLFYEDWKSQFPIRRADLDVNAVARQLFLKEAQFDTNTKIVNTIRSGFREYAEVALKLYVGQSASGRYGVKLSYNRGSLPPVFARVNSFQFGFIFESNEDSTHR